MSSSSNWHKVAALKDLETTGRKLFRKNGRQIVVFFTDQGVFACNNRCPHEGYPLKEGSLDGQCVLTCNWHNWKFNLRTGENLYGGDQLRTYPISIRSGDVWVDLTDPPFETRYTQILSNLRQAFEDNEYDRMGREIARLRLLGADPLDTVREAILWSYDRMEFGWTHAFAGACDWLALYDESEGDEEAQLVCLLEIVAHLADDVLREKTYPFVEKQMDYDEDMFVAAIEAEDEPKAIALVRGGLAGGLNITDIEHGLTRAALAHYNDFGHSLIYTMKATRLVRRLGEVTALPLLLSLIRSLVFATREDMIPEFRRYGSLVKRWDSRGKFNSVTADAYKGLSINKALTLAVDASRAPTNEHYHALLGANAYNMLTYDLYYQEQTTRPVQDNIGWLDFTHGLTFANAVRVQCTKFPELWPRGLLQLACFSGRNAPYTDASQQTDHWQVEDTKGFVDGTIKSLLDHGRDEFIVSVHLLKTACAIREELSSGVDPQVEVTLVAALNRFLNEPLKRKHTRRTAQQSIKFVARDG
ncbi:MAG: Rieske (2Fe-2S) protein [Arenicellales bacterium]|nr:Rieske (2Fe-2S) protein [Arenicellales bacterium]